MGKRQTIACVQVDRLFCNWSFIPDVDPTVLHATMPRPAPTDISTIDRKIYLEAPVAGPSRWLRPGDGGHKGASQLPGSRTKLAGQGRCARLCVEPDAERWPGRRTTHLLIRDDWSLNSTPERGRIETLVRAQLRTVGMVSEEFPNVRGQAYLPHIQCHRTWSVSVGRRRRSNRSQSTTGRRSSSHRRWKGCPEASGSERVVTPRVQLPTWRTACRQPVRGIQ